jgi:hypothetical protein
MTKCLRMSNVFGINFLLLISLNLSVLAQPKTILNTQFLTHLMDENLQMERLAYYKTVDFTITTTQVSIKDIIYLSAKFNDTLLFNNASILAKDTNDYLNIFYGAIILNKENHYTNAYYQLKNKSLSKSKLNLLFDMMNFVKGEVINLTNHHPFMTTSARINQLQNKSLLIAALLSTLLPGAGKYYLLQPNEANAMLLLNLMSALPLLECIIKLGLYSTGTILCAIVVLPIYLSNIYGTVVSKKMLLKKLNTQLKNEVFDFCFYHLYH